MGNRHSRGRSAAGRQAAADKRTQGRIPSVSINSIQPVNSDSETSATDTTPPAIARPPSQGREYRTDAALLNLTDSDVFRTVSEELVGSKNDEEQLAALKQVCALLCFRNNNRDLLTSIWYLAPKLMKIAGSDGSSETILLSVRAITYVCDVDKSVPVLLSRIGVVGILCRRLLEIEYMDVAELCLQSLEKISVSRPLSCLKAGAAMACLRHFDFFSVSIQRVAMSTVRNMCSELPLSCYRFVTEAFPTLCNILNHEDPKLIETTGSCLLRIAESFGGSPDILNELSNHSLVQNCVNLIMSKSGMAIRKANNNSLIGFLARLACGSPKAVRILLEINISSTLKDILSAYDAPQVYETLKLLIHLLPNISILDTSLIPLPSNISLQDADIQVSLEKKKIFMEQPKVLHQFAVDILPSITRVVSSGANLQVCYACVCIALTIVEISNSTVLVSLLEESKISRFMARLFTTNDPHVLVPALKMVGTLLYKHHPTFLNLFVREGIFHKIEELLKDSRQNVFHNRNMHSSVSSSQMYKSNSPRCLCYEFDLCQTASSSETDCKLESGIATTLAKHIKVFYFPLPSVSGTGSSEIIKLLKSHSLLLNEMVDKADYSSEGEECLTRMLEQIITGLLNCEEMTTFELIGSGVLKSIAHYLSNGQYLEQKCDLSAQSHSIIVSHRFQAFSKVIMSKHFQHGRRLLVQNLQIALSSQNYFHVVADVPLQHYPMDRFFKILFIRDGKESFLSNNSFNVFTIKPASFLDDVVKQIWPNIRPEDIEQHSESRACLTGITTDDILRTTDDNASLHASYFTSNECREQKLVFYLDGKELSQSLTLYQAILQHKMSTGHDLIVAPEFWKKVYTIVYRTAELPDTNSKDSPQVLQKGEEILEHTRSKDSTPEYDLSWLKLPFFSTLLSGKLPCELEKSLASYDILYILNVLEGLNRCALHMLSDEQCTAFAEGKISQIEDLNLVEYALPQSEFLNFGLNEKLEQQMREPSSLSAGCMPAWWTQLTSACPFLFSFKTRCKFFRLCTSDNSVYRHHPCLQRDTSYRHNFSGYVHNQNNHTVAASYRTFKVDRGNILASASKMIAMHASSKDVLEVKYSGEIGSGIGPTMEFYTLVGLEFQKVGLGLWREDHTCSVYCSGLITAPLGLFPRPWSDTRNSSNSDRFGEVIKKFTLLGRIVARALRDRRIFGLPLSTSFYKLILGKELGIYDILSFDPRLGKTLMEFQSIAKRKQLLDNNNEKSSDLLFQDAKIEDLCIEFSLPGYPDYAFAFTKGHDMISDINLEEYVALIVDATVRSGILRQLEAFEQGFNEVFPLQSLKLFSEDEIERLLCGEQDAWNLGELLDHIKFDHGYTAGSFAAINFMEIIQEFDRDQRRSFLQFVTGAPRLPPGGLASLEPKMTVVCKYCRDSDMNLPSAMTCFNYLKLPPYSSKEIMKERLLYAITEGQGSFHLS